MARIAFVVQRYGEEVNGGAELLCRMFAERMARHAEVEVLTTCAIDYVTWKNEYSPGEDCVNGIHVRRFPVDSPRVRLEFDRYSSWIFSNPHTREDELRWVDLQGPRVSSLLKYLQEHRRDYDCFVFFTYLYQTTCLGLPLVQDRALLVPTAHDEPPIYLGVYDEVFRGARRLMVCTQEEREFILRRFCLEEHAAEVIGVGIDGPAATEPGEFLRTLSPQLGDSRVLTYIGRIDESKGCGIMFEHFLRYVAERSAPNVKLLVIGKPVMPVPTHPCIVHAGFVSDAAKAGAMEATRVLLMPSPYESLSLVLLEAWAASKPVLVNGDCEVLRGQCRRSNGGLWYRSYEEFAECLDRMLDDDDLCTALGSQGRAHVLEHYTWERVESAFMSNVMSVCGRGNG
ncbi:MAG TPA: glycosyltransferase family 4 protein [Bryobacteraceae bacterium]|nr:glycosyltransferase family 4 protein [Bryobacteraceae bacterium]